MNAFISQISTSTPEFQYKQEEILAYMLRVLDLDAGKKISLQKMYLKSGISNRNSVLSTFQKGDSSHFPENVTQKMNLYAEKAPKLGLNAAQKCLEGINQDEITHLITVSCTGMSAPAWDLGLIKALNLNTSVERLSINFLGCYAGFIALKQANHICKSMPNAQVLIVSVELCTLHFDTQTDKETLAAQSLFSDGAAAVLVVGEQSEAPKKIKLLKAFSEFLENSLSDMAWNIEPSGFKMNLSVYVPSKISTHLKELAQQKYKTIFEQVQYWAIHPGGKKIIESVIEAGLAKKEDLQVSFEVLEKYGNMSSVSIFFVLKTLLQNSQKKGNTMAMGFGPGLTLEAFLLEIL